MWKKTSHSLPPTPSPPPGFHEVLNMKYIHSWMKPVILNPHIKSCPHLVWWETAFYECFGPLFISNKGGWGDKEGKLSQKNVGGEFGFISLI